MGGKRTAASRVRGGTQHGVLSPRVPWRLLRRVFPAAVRGASVVGELRCRLRTSRPDSSARIASGPKGGGAGDPAVALAAPSGAYSPPLRPRSRPERRSRCVASVVSPERPGWRQRWTSVCRSARLRRWRRVAAVRPVLKHGPRSAGGARVFGSDKPDVGRSESETWEPAACVVGAPRTEPCGHAVAGFESERTCCDPKDGELCPRRVKPGETLVEARSGSDVQIDRRTWV